MSSSKVDKYMLRVESAPTLREMIRPLDPKECSRIKASVQLVGLFACENKPIRNPVTTLAKSGWSEEIRRDSRSITTYGGLHARKVLDEPTTDRVRPSSPHRLNKPHPNDVFLVTRLRSIRGCFDRNAAATARYGGTARENLDNYVRSNRERIAAAVDVRPLPSRPQTSNDLHSNKAREKILTVFGPVRGQATEAWMKLSNDKDRKAIMSAIDNDEKQEKRVRETHQRIRRRRRDPISLRGNPVPQQSEIIYSSNRWLKRAGYEENIALTRLNEAFKSAPRQELPQQGPHFHITDYATIFSSAPKHYYDFQIHPEWHTPWHTQYEKQTAIYA